MTANLSFEDHILASRGRALLAENRLSDFALHVSDVLKQLRIV